MAQKHNPEYIDAPMTRFGSMGAQQDNKRIVRGNAYLSTKFSSDNPILQRGELGYETDTNLLKVGDGVTAWNDLPYAGDGGSILPDQTGNSGKFLTTDGTETSWADVLPDQSGHANEFLMTDGATATWKAVKPEDIGAVTQTTQQVTLIAADWQAGTPIMQGLSVPGVTPTNTVVVSPDPANATDYASAGVICVAQGTDYLEFNCTTQPANDLVVNILLLN